MCQRQHVVEGGEGAVVACLRVSRHDYIEIHRDDSLFARLERVGGETAAWHITDDPDGEPAEQPDSVTLTEFSTGATFGFERRQVGESVTPVASPHRR